MESFIVHFYQFIMFNNNFLPQIQFLRVCCVCNGLLLDLVLLHLLSLMSVNNQRGVFTFLCLNPKVRLSFAGHPSAE